MDKDILWMKEALSQLLRAHVYGDGRETSPSSVSGMKPQTPGTSFTGFDPNRREGLLPLTILEIPQRSPDYASRTSV